MKCLKYLGGGHFLWLVLVTKIREDVKGRKGQRRPWAISLYTDCRLPFAVVLVEASVYRQLIQIGYLESEKVLTKNP